MVHQPRISSIEEFPYRATLETYAAETRCSGTIISEYYVVTSASCVLESIYRVRVGSSSRDQGGTTHDVDSVVVHEKYNGSGYDLALVRLKKPVEFDYRTVGPIPVYEGQSEPGQAATASFWSSDGRLGSVQLEVVDRYYCREFYRDLDDDEAPWICAEFSIDDPLDCQGDSGGPLVVGKKLAGVASGQGGRALSRFPNLFSEVTGFRNWLHQKICC